MKKFLTKKVLIIGISSLVALAGIITAIILIVNANKHKNDPQTSAWHEVKFAMPAGLSEDEKSNIELPGTLMVEQGVTVAQLPIAKCKGQMFLGWYYDTDWSDENKLPVNLWFFLNT